MTAFQQALPEIESRGLQLMALSVDKPEILAAYREELGLTYTLLSDQGREVIQDWDRFNKFEMGGIAKPALFVIGSDLVVRLRSDGNMTRRATVEELIGFLDSGDRLANLEEPLRRRWIIPGPLMLLKAAPRWIVRLMRRDA